MVQFAEDFDQSLLEETLAVERGCCPFFRFEFAAATRRLSVGVERGEQTAALDALNFALTPTLPHPG